MECDCTTITDVEFIASGPLTVYFDGYTVPTTIEGIGILDETLGVQFDLPLKFGLGTAGEFHGNLVAGIVLVANQDISAWI